MAAILKFLVSVFSYIFSASAIKFVIFGLIFITVVEVIPILIEVFLPESVDLQSLLSAIDSDVVYFLAFFKVDFGIKAMLTAYVSRFLIRRIPFIG
ncbi:DUF2523 domain-containing protein [Pasteurella multocida]|nr:DUF2523 domain-containing protein [Pasteurella multocida]MDY0485039.1 DUF2523 domain-containing protein [Pasteurella multocida]MDY0534388.1 DUF2523 domain-containing protein [Pasteurella multocida]MDY0537126.1 DUF2523 domain-containing protein [Pasteurella multocida]MDY0555074.1 DUF2523 domain-containing protein [Pasteurella multocida]